MHSDKIKERVQDYPRPPRVEMMERHVRVVFDGATIADTHRAKRVLETTHPPSYYIPPEDIDQSVLRDSDHHTFCEWKGTASYYDLVSRGKTVRNAGWYYPSPTSSFAEIRYYVAFYPGRVDGCFVDDELVRPEAGHFYGGWITSEIEV